MDRPQAGARSRRILLIFGNLWLTTLITARRSPDSGGCFSPFFTSAQYSVTWGKASYRFSASESTGHRQQPTALKRRGAREVLLGFLWRNWWPVIVAAVTVAGDGTLTTVFKQALSRPRPPLAHVLAYLCTARLRPWAGRVMIWPVAVVLAALVGISRVYLGVHWTTDVLGGWTVGISWLAVVITSWSGHHIRR